MFEKYTLEAQKILTMAESIAFSFGNDEVSEGHLLLAFLKNEENEVSKALADYNIDENIIKNKLMEESEEKEFAAPIYMAYNFKLKKILDDCMKIKENENVISTFVLGFSLLKNLDDSYFQILQIEDKNEVLKKYKKLYKRCSNLDKIVELHRMGDRKLDPLIGREEILDELITTLKRRNKPNPILVGEPGVGKSFIVEHLSKKINEGEIKELQGKVVFELDLPSAVSGTKYRGEFEEKIKKIIQKVIDEKNVILFIDEIHRLNRSVEEILYPAMEDYALDIVIGKGAAAKSIRLDLPQFTLIGATTRIGMLTSPLRDRFGVLCSMEYYTVEQLKEIVIRSALVFGCNITEEGAIEIARRSRGTPRIANRLLKRVRDYAEVYSNSLISYKEAKAALELLEVDDKGFDRVDNKILEAIIDNFNGGPVGIETLSYFIGEELGTIEDVYEPYLLKNGFIQRTPKGRVVTEFAYHHLGIHYEKE